MGTVTDIVGRLETVIIKPALLLVFTAGFFIFVWGLVVFLFNLDEGPERDKGKKHMIYGLIGMFIMVSVYGILTLLSDTFNLGCDPKKGTCNYDMSRIERATKPIFDASGLNK